MSPGNRWKMPPPWVILVLQNSDRLTVDMSFKQLCFFDIHGFFAYQSFLLFDMLELFAPSQAPVESDWSDVSTLMELLRGQELQARTGR